jgi:hypothetical protein
LRKTSLAYWQPRPKGEHWKNVENFSEVSPAILYYALWLSP